MAQITTYDAVDSLDDEDVFLIDGGDGTRTIQTQDLQWALFDGVPEMHRNLYRGNRIGQYITDEQYGYIQDGSFHDMYVGDYWRNSTDSIAWYIADINYFPGIGNHIVIVPNKPVSTYQMLDLYDSLSNMIDYADSLSPSYLYYRDNTFRELVQNDTENQLMSSDADDENAIINTALTTNVSTIVYPSLESVDQFCDLMSATMVAGYAPIVTSFSDNHIFELPEPRYPQFALFQLRPEHTLYTTCRWLLQNIVIDSDNIEEYMLSMHFNSSTNSFGFQSTLVSGSNDVSVAIVPFVCIG